MPAGGQLRALLRHGDRRTVGNVPEVVATVTANRRLLPELVQHLFDEDAGVRMRAADALGKISGERAGNLQPYAEVLAALLEETRQQELCWHLAQILPRLRLTHTQCGRVAAALQRCLGMRSSIVRTFALQGLTDLVAQDESLRPLVIDLLRSAARTGTPAMKARSRRLLPQMEGGREGSEPA